MAGMVAFLRRPVLLVCRWALRTYPPGETTRMGGVESDVTIRGVALGACNGMSGSYYDEKILHCPLEGALSARHS